MWKLSPRLTGPLSLCSVKRSTVCVYKFLQVCLWVKLVLNNSQYLFKPNCNWLPEGCKKWLTLFLEIIPCLFNLSTFFFCIWILPKCQTCNLFFRQILKIITCNLVSQGRELMVCKCERCLPEGECQGGKWWDWTSLWQTEQGDSGPAEEASVGHLCRYWVKMKKIKTVILCRLIIEGKQEKVHTHFVQIFGNVYFAQKQFILFSHWLSLTSLF